MRFISKLLVFSIVGFITSLSHAAPNDSTADFIIPITYPMTLCAQVYVNNRLMTSINYQNPLQGFPYPEVDPNCEIAYSPGSAQYEFLGTGPIPGVPVGSIRVVEDSMVRCPVDHPIPQAIVLWADTGPSSANYSLRAYCCRSGFTMSVRMVWILGTSCP